MADAVALAGKVTGKLSNLVVTREGNRVNAEWKVPAYLKDETYNRRLTSVDAYIDFNCSPDSNKQVVEVWRETFDVPSHKPLATTLNYDHYFVRGLESDGGWTSTSNAGEDFEKPYDRNRYYPKTSKKCTGIRVGVHGVNDYGSYDDTYQRGPNVYQTFPSTSRSVPSASSSGGTRAPTTAPSTPSTPTRATRTRRRTTRSAWTPATGFSGRTTSPTRVTPRRRP